MVCYFLIGFGNMNYIYTCIKYSYINIELLDIPHKFVFACDNGDIPVKYNEEVELKKIKNIHSKKEKN